MSHPLPVVRHARPVPGAVLLALSFIGGGCDPIAPERGDLTPGSMTLVVSSETGVSGTYNICSELGCGSPGKSVALFDLLVLDAAGKPVTANSFNIHSPEGCLFYQSGLDKETYGGPGRLVGIGCPDTGAEVTVEVEAVVAGTSVRKALRIRTTGARGVQVPPNGLTYVPQGHGARFDVGTVRPARATMPAAEGLSAEVEASTGKPVIRASASAPTGDRKRQLVHLYDASGAALGAVLVPVHVFPAVAATDLRLSSVPLATTDIPKETWIVRSDGAAARCYGDRQCTVLTPPAGRRYVSVEDGKPRLDGGGSLPDIVDGSMTAQWIAAEVGGFRLTYGGSLWDMRSAPGTLVATDVVRFTRDIGHGGSTPPVVYATRDRKVVTPTDPGGVTLPAVPERLISQYQAYAALLPNGEVWTWGYGAPGLLGHGSTASLTVPTRISGLPPITRIYRHARLSADGVNALVAFTASGEAWMWGHLVQGCPTTPCPTPRRQPEYDGAAGIFEGWALNADGTLRAGQTFGINLWSWPPEWRLAVPTD